MLAACISLLTACGSDTPAPSVKPTSGYFTYYLLTNEQTLAAMQITSTLYTDSEDKSDEVTIDKCINLDEVDDAQARSALQTGMRNFSDKSDIAVYQVRFASEQAPNVSLTYGLQFVPLPQDASSTPNPNLCYGYLITFTPNVGEVRSISGTFQYTQGVRKDRLADYANLQNSCNEPRTQRVLLSAVR